MRFADRVVVVTGAGVGIGYGVCQSFAAEGATVALNDVDPQLAMQSAANINQQIGAEKVFPFGGDVGDVVHTRQMISTIAARFGRIDIAICLAGITLAGKFLEYEPENFDRLMGVNLRGTYFTAQAAARSMIAAQENGQPTGGRIILMSSVTGVQAFDNLGTYGISKAAIRMMAPSMALELGKYGITVNAVAPGATMTERTMSEPNYEAGWAQVTPNKRIATVDDVTATILFLCSPEARHISGQTILIDGGWTTYSPLPANE